jgi:hypothetical protein
MQVILCSIVSAYDRSISRQIQQRAAATAGSPIALTISRIGCEFDPSGLGRHALR